jgi:hypothetical protein
MGSAMKVVLTWIAGLLAIIGLGVGLEGEFGPAVAQSPAARPTNTFARPSPDCLKELARAYCELLTATEVTTSIPSVVPVGGAIVVGPRIRGQYSVYLYLRPAAAVAGGISARRAVAIALSLDNATGLRVTHVLLAAATLPADVPPLIDTGQIDPVSGYWSGSQVID